MRHAAEQNKGGKEPKQRLERHVLAPMNKNDKHDGNHEVGRADR
jgi:hypothetical protein